MIYAYLLTVLFVVVGIMSSNAFRKLIRSTPSSTVFRRNTVFATLTARSIRGLSTSRLPLSKMWNFPIFTGSMPRGNRAIKLAAALYALSASTTTSAAPAVAPVEYFRKDYKPLPYSTDEIHMDFKLGLEESTLTTKNMIKRTSMTVEDLTFDGNYVYALPNRIHLSSYDVIFVYIYIMYT